MVWCLLWLLVPLSSMVILVQVYLQWLLYEKLGNCYSHKPPELLAEAGMTQKTSTRKSSPVKMSKQMKSKSAQTEIPNGSKKVIAKCTEEHLPYVTVAGYGAHFTTPIPNKSGSIDKEGILPQNTMLCRSVSKQEENFEAKDTQSSLSKGTAFDLPCKKVIDVQSSSCLDSHEYHTIIDCGDDRNSYEQGLPDSKIANVLSIQSEGDELDYTWEPKSLQECTAAENLFDENVADEDNRYDQNLIVSRPIAKLQETSNRVSTLNKEDGPNNTSEANLLQAYVATDHILDANLVGAVSMRKPIQSLEEAGIEKRIDEKNTAHDTKLQHMRINIHYVAKLSSAKTNMWRSMSFLLRLAKMLLADVSVYRSATASNYHQYLLSIKIPLSTLQIDINEVPRYIMRYLPAAEGMAVIVAFNYYPGSNSRKGFDVQSCSCLDTLENHTVTDCGDCENGYDQDLPDSVLSIQSEGAGLNDTWEPKHLEECAATEYLFDENKVDENDIYEQNIIVSKPPAKLQGHIKGVSTHNKDDGRNNTSQQHLLQACVATDHILDANLAGAVSMRKPIRSLEEAGIERRSDKTQKAHGTKPQKKRVKILHVAKLSSAKTRSMLFLSGRTKHLVADASVYLSATAAGYHEYLLTTKIPLNTRPIHINDSPRYLMRYLPSGVGMAVIIALKDYPRGGSRKGVDMDVENWRRLWLSRGFKVHVVYNPTLKDMQDTIEYYKNFDHSSYDAFVICFTAHGFRGHILDGRKQPLNILTHVVDPLSNCQSLRGKPKMVCVQACQSQSSRSRNGLPIQEEIGQEVGTQGTSHGGQIVTQATSASGAQGGCLAVDIGTHANAQWQRRRATGSDHVWDNTNGNIAMDTLVPDAESTDDSSIYGEDLRSRPDTLLSMGSADAISWRDTKYGSLYPLSSCRNFDYYMGRVDVVSVLDQRVNPEVGEMSTVMMGERQTTACLSSLDKKLHFSRSFSVENVTVGRLVIGCKESKVYSMPLSPLPPESHQ